MTDGYDREAPDEYRPVSMSAVFALVAGCGSALALMTQVLWGLPLLAVCLAVVGIRDTAEGPAQKAGRGLALIGLALAVGFGVQAVGAAVVGSWVNKSRAVETVMRWQQTISSNDWIAAQDFCFPVALPAAKLFGGENHVRHDRDDGDQSDSADTPQLLVFRSLPVVQAISEYGPAKVISCQWDEGQPGGSWRVNLALPGETQPSLSVWLNPETKSVPRLTPEATGLAEVELWRISHLEPAPEQ